MDTGRAVNLRKRKGEDCKMLYSNNRREMGKLEDLDDCRLICFADKDVLMLRRGGKVALMKNGRKGEVEWADGEGGEVIGAWGGGGHFIVQTGFGSLLSLSLYLFILCFI